MSRHHIVTGRHTWPMDALWNGAIGCACGWTRSVFGHPTQEEAEDGLETAWDEHLGRDNHL